MGISDRTVRDIIHQDLGPQKIKGRLVSKLQTTYDKTTRKICAENLLEKYEENWAQFKGRFIFCDETWLMYEQPETKESAAEWRAPGVDPPLVPKIKKNRRKIMGVFFWDAEGIIMVDFVHASKSVTGKYYAELIHKLAAEVNHKRPSMRRRGVILLYDNARAHISHLVDDALNAIRYNYWDTLLTLRI